jgi:quercetin dioxygenase-like cupin family protein
MIPGTDRREHLTRVNPAPALELAPGVAVKVLASGDTGARGLATCTATLAPGAFLPYHTHPCGEVIIPMEGAAEVHVEGRSYQLAPFDALHVPAGIAHRVANASTDQPAVLFTAFSSEVLARSWVEDEWSNKPAPPVGDATPESLTRFDTAPAYELAPNTRFRDLFSRRLGARGICGGYGRFQPGSSLPCHIHGYDESITIVEGAAICQVAGQEYPVSDLDTACIPEARPHRFLNRSDVPMAMLWVYAGDEPDRTILDACHCEK